MRSLLLLLGFVFVGSLHAQDIEIPCDGSPSQAILNVPKPADRFLHVLCTRFGHVLAPTVGWFWTLPGTYNPLFFPAQMVREDPKDSGNSIYFKSIAVSSLIGKAAQEKWSILAERFPHETSPGKVLEITAENDSGDRHLIYIFPNAWGYSCSPSCRKENAFIMVSQVKTPPQW